MENTNKIRVRDNLTLSFCLYCKDCKAENKVVEYLGEY
nr:MAG TPA: hypothetical protein [Crassvirales sp.]